ncbi:glycosyltransferase family 4 protein [Roseiflexus sp.]|uniref:glycosyltransferase family 4 protein n=1 Tax=Roseiflexus sp. TaxID=2562120 RepID=UPI00398AFE4A
MRILALTSWWPEPANNGSRLRIANLLRALARNHEVHLVSFRQEAVTAQQIQRMLRVCASVDVVPQRVWRPRPGEQIASLWRSEPASVRATWSPEFAARVSERAMDVRPDIVVAFQINTAPYALHVARVPRLLEELEVGNIHTQYIQQTSTPRRLRAWLTWRKHAAYVQNLLRHFDACTVVSENEQRLVRQIAPEMQAIHVLPNGADVRSCAKDWGQPEPDTLIYPGALTYDANFDAVKYFISEIFPRVRNMRPGIRFVVTGAAPPELRSALPQMEGVHFAGYVDDVRPLIARSWCEVVPLRQGGGTRLKVLEALALGTPVVSTPKGVEGLDLEHNVHVLIAQTAGEFADATLNLLERPDVRARLAAEGRRRVVERYDWRVIGEQFNALLDHVVERSQIAVCS